MLKLIFQIVQGTLAVVGLAAVLLFVLKVKVITWEQGRELSEERIREQTTFEMTLTPTERFAAMVWEMQRLAKSREDMTGLPDATAIVLIVGDGPAEK